MTMSTILYIVLIVLLLALVAAACLLSNCHAARRFFGDLMARREEKRYNGMAQRHTERQNTKYTKGSVPVCT